MHVEGSQFKDEFGRTLLLRGVNLGGSSKYPVRPDGASHNLAGFFEHRDVSFVGRPFALEEADEHFRRLKRWGFRFLRFLVTWEAIEHAGPGQYDQAYLEYLEAVVRKASEHGLRLFIDPHQDVWSRFSGGDGAPGWTLEAAGFDMRNFKETGAAIVHQTRGDPFPRMIWPTNGVKLAAATMFSLFFGGNDFAPRTLVDGEPIQEFLQRHYVAAIVEVAKRLRGIDVVGYDTLNEPLSGWIGWQDLQKPGGLLRMGDTPSPYQAMLLGAGIPQTVERHAITLLGMRAVGKRLLNQNRVSAWLPGRTCIWRENGVWDEGPDGPRLLRPQHFSAVGGRTVHFENDYFRPFAERYLKGIRKVNSDAILFLETEAAKAPPDWPAQTNVVFAPHWYDAFLLVTKHQASWLAVDFRTERPVFGAKNIRKSFAGQLRHLAESGRRGLGDVPVLLGEFGIPFDLHQAKAYRTRDFRQQIRALDRSFKAVEDNLLHCTLWNYTAGNTHARGDGWNGEDLSVFSVDDRLDPADPDSGGRALEAAVRPYPLAVAGELQTLTYDWKTRACTIAFRHDPRVAAPTEIYVPPAFGADYQVACPPGKVERDVRQQLLRYTAAEGVTDVVIHLRGAPPAK